MKPKLLIFILFFTFPFCYSQTDKPLKGIVLCDDAPVQGIEVVNLVTEKTSITNSKGEFSILAKVEDMIVFVSEKYEYKRVFLDKEFLDKNNFTILLTRKPEQLDEVVVFKIPNIKLSKDKAYEQGKINELVLEKAARNPKPIGVYDGTLVNSPDLIRIGGMILSIFKKENDTPKKVSPEIKFKDIALTTYEEDFFINTLNLKPDEIALFLEFCDTDPKSKTILNNNPLSLMDFILTKNEEFKKLPTSEKK